MNSKRKNKKIAESSASSSHSTQPEIFIKFVDRPIEQDIQAEAMLEGLNIIANDLARLVDPQSRDFLLKFLKRNPEKNREKYNYIREITSLKQHGIKDLYDLNEIYFIKLEYESYVSKMQKHVEQLESSLEESTGIKYKRKSLTKLLYAKQNLFILYHCIIDAMIVRLKKIKGNNLSPSFNIARGFAIMINDFLQSRKCIDDTIYRAYLQRLDSIFTWLKLAKYTNKKDDTFIQNFIREYILPEANNTHDIAPALKGLDTDLNIIREASTKEGFPSDNELRQRVVEYFGKYVLKKIFLAPESHIYCENLFSFLALLHSVLFHKPITVVSYKKVSHQIHCLRQGTKPEVVTQPAFDIVFQYVFEVFYCIFTQIRNNNYQEKNIEWLQESIEMIVSILKDIDDVQDQYKNDFSTSSQRFATLQSLYLDLNEELKLILQQKLSETESRYTEEQKIELANQLIQQEEEEKRLANANQDLITSRNSDMGFLPSDETIESEIDEEDDLFLEHKVKRFFTKALAVSHFENKDKAIQAMKLAFELAVHSPNIKEKIKNDAAICLAYYSIEQCKWLYQQCIYEIKQIFSRVTTLKQALEDLQSEQTNIDELYQQHKGKPYQIAKIVNHYKWDIDCCLKENLQEPISYLLNVSNENDSKLKAYIFQEQKRLLNEMQAYFSDVQQYLALTKMQFSDIYKSHRLASHDMTAVLARSELFEQANSLLMQSFDIVDLEEIEPDTVDTSVDIESNIQKILKQQGEQQTVTRMSIFWINKNKQLQSPLNVFTKIISVPEENNEIVSDLLNAKPEEAMLICCQEIAEVSALVNYLMSKEHAIQDRSVFLTEKTVLPLSGNIQYIFTTPDICETFHLLLANWKVDNFVLLNADHIPVKFRQTCDALLPIETTIIMTGKNPPALPRTKAERDRYINSMMLAYEEATEIFTIDDIQNLLSKIQAIAT